MAENDRTYGTLIVRVTSADSAIPISDATVALRFVGEDGPVIFSVLVTDASGATPEVRIPTPSPSLSLEPSPSSKPYSTVNIEVTAAGYYSSANLSVPVFSGVTSIQNVNMIALPDEFIPGGVSPNVIVFESASPNL